MSPERKALRAELVNLRNLLSLFYEGGPEAEDVQDAIDILTDLERAMRKAELGS